MEKREARKAVEMLMPSRWRGCSCVRRRRGLFRVVYAEEEEEEVFGDVIGGGGGRSCWRVIVW